MAVSQAPLVQSNITKGGWSEYGGGGGLKESSLNRLVHTGVILEDVFLCKTSFMKLGKLSEMPWRILPRHRRTLLCFRENGGSFLLVIYMFDLSEI